MTQTAWDTAWQGTSIFPCELEPLDESTTHPKKPRLKMVGVLIAAVLALTVTVGVVGKASQRMPYKIPSTANVQVTSGVGEVQNHLTFVPVRPISLPSPVVHPKPIKEQVSKHVTHVSAPSQPMHLASRSEGFVDYSGLQWLAQMVQAEAGNQSYAGKVAVADVVINRTHDSQFPHTIYGVIFERGQFETVSNGHIYNHPTAEDYAAARAALSGEDVVGDALYFENPSIVRERGNDWMATRVQIACIGEQCFYR